VGAGDIATCGQLDGAEATAKLIDKIREQCLPWATWPIRTVRTTSLPIATADLGPIQGSHAPAAGNHEYHSDGASGYARYFGGAAGDPKKGYYSYELGAWHIIVINTANAIRWGGCDAASPQGKWLKEDLAASSAKCTLAYWHKPLLQFWRETRE